MKGGARGRKGRDQCLQGVENWIMGKGGRGRSGGLGGQRSEQIAFTTSKREEVDEGLLDSIQ